jgi:putative oxidoreductase
MFHRLATEAITPLILRLALAAVFIFHGLEKVSPEVDYGASWGAKMPDPPHRMLQAAVAWGELIGGIALALGLLTRAAAVGIGAIMVGAIVTATGQNGFSLMNHGFEYNFVLLAMCVALMLTGGGPLAADRFLLGRRRKA